MPKNKLMEAAAEILSSGKSKASAMPPQKLPGEEVDLGGPTPQNAKPDDDSHKIDATKAAKSATAPTTKPSAASSKMEETELENYSLEELQEFMVSEEFEQLDELSKSTLGSYVNKASKDAVKSSSASTNWARTSDRARNPRVKIAAAQYSNEEEAREKKRLTGISKAVKKITEMHGDEAEDKAMMEKMKMKEKMKEDVDALFADDNTISEEFKSKVSTIFEARVIDRIQQIEEQTEAKYADMLEEAIESVRTQLEEKVDDYVNYVVEQWLEENAIAIESGLRAELAEDFISGLHKLFAENYINVPEDKVELVDELATKVEQLESKLNEEIEKSIGYKKSLIEATKQEVTRSVCEGLTETQVEKIKSLAESVEFSTEEEYQIKLETIRENYFPSGVKKADEEQLHEQVSAEDAGETKKQVSADPYVSSVANAISKTKL